MKKRYQIDQQRAVQELRQLAREENPNLPRSSVCCKKESAISCAKPGWH